VVPVRAARGLEVVRTRAFRADRVPVRRVGRARGDRDARDRGDRCQRLAAKPIVATPSEVVQRLDLARCVARERERQVGVRDAGTVVLDLDAANPALIERDCDRRRTGVEAVLEQLLQHRAGRSTTSPAAI
jgi:hypothetical protein